MPAAPSLSITLDTLCSTTRVTIADRDTIRFDGRTTADPKIAAALEAWRTVHHIAPLAIETHNNFPTAAGLASSASGFAALVTAVDAVCALGLDAGEKSALARIGSGSAARSIYGGFVELAPPAWQAQPVAPAAHWPLCVAIAVTDSARKDVPSSAGMERSRLTSPYYDAWIGETTRQCEPMRRAIEARDFEMLADLAEASCLAMHAVMLSTRPGLIYWSAATVACVHRVRALRSQGVPVFFTVDAGPQVKAVCTPDSRARVAAALGAIEGVETVIETGLGPGATLIETPT